MSLNILEKEIRVREVKRKMKRINSRIMLNGKLITTTGLHIGSGGSLEPVGSDNLVIRDALGNPFIPASSFKGVVRSKAEEILRTINIKKNSCNLWACEVTGGESSWCVKKEDFDTWKDEWEKRRKTSNSLRGIETRL